MKPQQSRYLLILKVADNFSDFPEAEKYIEVVHVMFKITNER